MKTKKIPLVIYTVIVAGLTILGTRLYDSVSDTTDPAIANGPFWAGLWALLQIVGGDKLIIPFC
ncbi:hypothetical protein [Raoultella ornithinolytica]|uniref:hypothetical protein n=1 Tax=Raoultella ornithinolytica TaxID=54291 RepID=UPI0015E2E723|nr:hypothetical protein [Raoultella ornithinolytica]